MPCSPCVTVVPTSSQVPKPLQYRCLPKAVNSNWLPLPLKLVKLISLPYGWQCGTFMPPPFSRPTHPGFWRYLATKESLLRPTSAYPMTYNIKFHTLAASYPILRWDHHHIELYMECLSGPKQQP